jgi:transposase
LAGSRKRKGTTKSRTLFDEAEANATGEETRVTEKIVVPAHERKKRGRKPKIDPLPVREVVYELNEEERACPCCGKARREIGEERSSEYDLVPAHLVKIVHIRKKYGPCACMGFTESEATSVITAGGPAKIVKGSDFTNRTIAFFLTGKYADALPFYRMEKVLERSGLVIPRATLSNLAISVGRSLGDLIELMNRDIARSPVLLMDETTVQVLKTGEGPPGKSYMWGALGYRDGKPIRRFAYHKNREGSFADKLLQGFSGYLQTDGYGGYLHLEGRPDIVHVSCFAHIRRKFVEAVKVASNQSKARKRWISLPRYTVSNGSVGKRWRS